MQRFVFEMRSGMNGCDHRGGQGSNPLTGLNFPAFLGAA